MAKKKRRTFPGDESREKRNQNRPARRVQPEPEVIDADDYTPGLFGFFRSPGRREFIESLVIAILLAFMFKSFEAEAFIIPTGSMAPSLQGQHMDLACAQCGYRYLTGASSETHGQNVIATNCPICRYHTVMDVRVDAEHRSNSGDRILVNKFIYDFSEPKRFDVIVFKNPQNGKQNYIKRLIGLPGENILIENGDIYVMTPNGDRWDREICVKSPEKLRQVLIEVDDTKYIGHELETAGWPSRWNQWTQKPSWSIDASGGNNEWHVDAQSDTEWLRYRHLHPVVSQWPTIKTGKLPTYMEVDSPVDLPPGRLITDTHAYNDYDLERIRHPGRNPTGFGYHWVGDIGLEAWCDIESDSGVLELDIVEGGVHFSCKIDVGSGEATLHSSDPTIGFFNDAGDKVATPTATGVVNGSGTAQLCFLTLMTSYSCGLTIAWCLLTRPDTNVIRCRSQNILPKIPLMQSRSESEPKTWR